MPSNPSTASPSRSPRLPSPPPFPEVQIGPKSPTVNDRLHSDSDELLGAQQGQEDASARRIRPGTKAADMASGPPLIPLAMLDSPFQLQEHLKAAYHNFTRPSGSKTTIPITQDVARTLAQPPEGVERSLWLYELCRFLTMKANNLVIAFFAEDPPCSVLTCSEMRASEWQYLCAVHDPPKPCCAIDYCCHTLDWATNLLTSPKHFPSRLTLGSDAAGGPQASMRHLTNIFRRVYRIFAHAWFQHREVFWQVEGSDGLYVFFKTVCDVYNLIPEDSYTIPLEAEGQEAAQDDKGVESQEPNKRLTILRKENGSPNNSERSEEPKDAGLSMATTATRRHRHSPSTGVGVTTITEVAEDDETTKTTQGTDTTSDTEEQTASGNEKEATDKDGQSEDLPAIPESQPEPPSDENQVAQADQEEDNTKKPTSPSPEPSVAEIEDTRDADTSEEENTAISTENENPSKLNEANKENDEASPTEGADGNKAVEDTAETPQDTTEASEPEGPGDPNKPDEKNVTAESSAKDESS